MSGRFPVSLNQLNSTVGALSASDLFVLFKQSQGGTVNTPLTLLIDLMQNSLNFEANQFSSAYTVENAAPVSSDTILINAGEPTTANTYLELNNVALVDPLTIVLPPSSGCIDVQEVVVARMGSSVLNLSINANGAGTIGLPVPFNFFVNTDASPLRLRFNKASNTWFRIG